MDLPLLHVSALPFFPPSPPPQYQPDNMDDNQSPQKFLAGDTLSTGLKHPACYHPGKKQLLPSATAFLEPFSPGQVKADHSKVGPNPDREPKTPIELQRPAVLLSPTATGNDSIISRPRPGSSPFFGRPQISPRTSSSNFSQKGSRGSSSPSSSLIQSPDCKHSVVIKGPRTFSGSSVAQDRYDRVPEARSLSTSGSPKVAPCKVVRPDNWWQKGRLSTSAESEESSKSSAFPKIPQSSPGTLAPPAIPEKSPLRALLSDLPTNHQLNRHLRHFPKGSELQDLLEQEALRLELSPPPLRANKVHESPAISTESESSHMILAPPEAQGNIEDPDEVPLSTRQRVLKNVLSEESFTETTKPGVADRVEEAEGSWKRRHRKLTFEAPEGSHLPSDCKEFTESGSLPRSEPEIKKPKMNSLHPESAAALTAHRREAIRLAKSQERAVVERCKRSNQEPPGYSFDELIGKGSFGRVYKGRQNATNKVVAIKVLDVDDADFQAYGQEKDEQMKDFNREIRILRQAQDSGAENLNQMIEALPVHSQLWLICEHCPGGSVKTLMRATNDRLAEKYIIVVARELAKALKGLHAAGIIHRDIKAANVLIHEEGRLELCDFGVANVLDNRTDKRRTFIGTLHWMPPELWSEKPEYSDEVDVWEYGCTLYECALGRPPNSDLRERQQLKMRMRRLKQAIALPDNEDFSEGLRSLVTYALSPDVTSRPSMKDVLEHKFLANTDETNPTSVLSELVQNYYGWLFGGGQRVSLFMPGGAAAAAMEDPDSEITQSDEWNFSTTQDFERRVSAILEIPDLSDLSTADLEGEETPKQPKVTNLSPPRHMTAAQKANFEARVNRGAADLTNLFDEKGPVYEYKTKTDFVPVPEARRTSDLPFRAMAEDRPSSIASNVIDLGEFDEEDYAVAAPRTDENIQTTLAVTPMKEQTIRLADASTLRQKRADSKGPREPQSLTARRASSADDAAGRDTGTASYDFAAAQADWTLKDKGKAPELQQAAEITSSKPGHATMDWSFADAMKSAPGPEELAARPSLADEPGPEEPTSSASKAKTRATLDWSFSDALSELNAAGDIQSSVNISPPTSRTPRRPAPLHRQMTMPVTHADFEEAEREPPRPSTALSEAYSESSQSSADVDPFGLEQREEDYPGPRMLDEVGISGFYASRGRTLGDYPPVSAPPGGNVPAPYSTAPVTGGAYPFGRPPRIGEAGFSGPTRNETTIPIAPARHDRSRGSGSSTNNSSMNRPTIEVPETAPPSLPSLAGTASNEVMEAELMRLLEEMQGTLGAAGRVVQGLERRGRRGDSEWEDEE